MSEVLLVFTNLSDVESAETLARKIVESRTAACVSQLPPCVSTYHWNGTIETSTEVMLLIKTTRDAYPALEKLISLAHPYELPEIIAVPVMAGLPAYLGWVDSETRSKKE